MRATVTTSDSPRDHLASAPTALSGSSSANARRRPDALGCPIKEIFVGDTLVIRTNCAGVVTWSSSAPSQSGETALAAVGGVMAGAGRHQARLGPFLLPGELAFRFECRHPGCDCQQEDACCQAGRKARSPRAALRGRDGAKEHDAAGGIARVGWAEGPHEDVQGA